MKTAIIYARYSTSNQNPQSVEDQIGYCKDHLRKNGEIQLLSTFCDSAIPGTNVERTGLENLVNYVSIHDIDYVVTESLDRLSRDPEQTHSLYKIFNHFRVEIMSVNEGIISPLHIALKGTMNWMYSKETAEKVMRSHRSRAKEGLLPGGKAYGYKVKIDAIDAQGKRINGVREIIQEQAEIVKRIFQMYADGAGSKAIAQRLNLEGIPSPSGGSWVPSTILGTKSRASGILFNNIYRGKLIYNRIQRTKNPLTRKRNDLVKSESEWVETDVPHLQIINEELWNKVQSRLMKPKSPLEKPPEELSRSLSNKHLSGLIVCGICGSKCQRANGSRYVCGSYRTYRICKNARGVKSDAIMNELYQYLNTYINETDFEYTFAEIFSNDKKKIERHNLELLEIDKNIEHFVAVIQQGIALETITNTLKELQSQRAQLIANMRMNVPENGNNKTIVYRLQKALEDMLREYESKSFAPSWRAAMSLVVDKIITTPIPDKKKGMTIDVKLAPMEGWAEFYRRITAKKAHI